MYTIPTYLDIIMVGVRRRSKHEDVMYSFISINNNNNNNNLQSNTRMLQLYRLYLHFYTMCSYRARHLKILILLCPRTRKPGVFCCQFMSADQMSTSYGPSVCSIITILLYRYYTIRLTISLRKEKNTCAESDEDTFRHCKL